MATTVNLLDYNNALLRRNPSGNTVAISEYSTGWSVTGATLSITTDNAIVDTRYVIRLNPSSSGAVTLTLSGVSLRAFDNNRKLSFNCKLLCNSECTVHAKLYIDSNTSTEAQRNTSSSGRFTAIHSNVVQVDDDESAHTYTIQLVITNHQQLPISITNFHLIHDFAFYENFFVSRMRPYFPDFYWDYDSQESAPTYPFFRLLDVLSSDAGETKRLYDLIFPYEINELGSPGEHTAYWARSILTDPALVRDDYVPWLAQFTGIRIQRNVFLSDGSLYFNNQLLERDYVEWQLRTGYYGHASGSRRALIEAAQQFLIRTKDGSAPTKEVAVTNRYNGDPFSILVETLANETIDANDGEESKIILQSLNLARPMGYQITHRAVDEFEFTLDSLSTGRFDEFRWG